MNNTWLASSKAFLDRLADELDPATYERVLEIASGEPGGDGDV